MGTLNDDRLGPWPRGLNNRDTDSKIPEGALRLARNVDVTRTGIIRRRAGYTERVSGSYHSLWGNGSEGYVVKNDALTRLTVSGNTVTETELRTGLASAMRMAYVAVNERVYYSNDVVTGCVVAGVDRPWGVEHAGSLPVAAAVASGGLDAGAYQIAVTFVADDGEEGGTAASVSVNVAQGGGVSLSAIPQPAAGTVSWVRVYVTQANSRTFYRYADLAVGTTTLLISKSATLGMVLETWDLYPPPPGGVLELHNGCIWVGSGRRLWFTEPLRYGQVKRTNSYLFPAEISVIARLSSQALMVAADRHYLLMGADPYNLTLVKSHDYPAVKGTRVTLPDGETRAWASTRGWMMPGEGGVVEVLRDKVEIDVASRGGALYRETNGEDQILISLHDGVMSPSVSERYTQAETTRLKPGVNA